MTTDTAQRRLLEALADMHTKSAGSDLLTDFADGLRVMANALDTWAGVSGLYRALADLAEAVRHDQTEKETSA